MSAEVTRGTYEARYHDDVIAVAAAALVVCVKVNAHSATVCVHGIIAFIS
jgi:hypothetical protein